MRLYFWPALESLRMVGIRSRTLLATLHTHQITRQLSPAWKTAPEFSQSSAFVFAEDNERMRFQHSFIFFFTCPRQSCGGVNGVPFIVSVGDGRVTSPSGGTLDVLIQTRALSSSVWRQRIGREAGNIHYLNIRTFCQ